MKSVVNDFIIQKNKLGGSITPIYLYAIQYDSVGNNWLYYTTSPVDVTFDGQAYTRHVVNHSAIFEESGGVLGNLTLKVGNADRSFQYYLDNYGGLKKKRCLLKIVWKEALDNPDCYLEYEYYIDSATAQDDFATVKLGSAIDVLDILAPKRIYSPTRCQVCEFKDEDCGYSGAGSTCNRSFNNCESLGNISRLGCFPGVPLVFKEILE